MSFFNDLLRHDLEPDDWFRGLSHLIETQTRASQRNGLGLYSRALQAIETDDLSALKRALASPEAQASGAFPATRLGALAAKALESTTHSRAMLHCLFDAGLPPDASFWTRKGAQTLLGSFLSQGDFKSAILIADALRAGASSRSGAIALAGLSLLVERIGGPLDGMASMSSIEKGDIKELAFKLADLCLHNGVNPSLISSALACDGSREPETLALFRALLGGALPSGTQTGPKPLSEPTSPLSEKEPGPGSGSDDSALANARPERRILNSAPPSPSRGPRP